MPKINAEARFTDERGIFCPRCECRHFYTTNTEPLENGTIRRRKECRHCFYKIITVEGQPLNLAGGIVTPSVGIRVRPGQPTPNPFVKTKPTPQSDKPKQPKRAPKAKAPAKPRKPRARKQNSSADTAADREAGSAS